MQLRGQGSLHGGTGAKSWSFALRGFFLTGRQPPDVEGTRGMTFHWNIACGGSRCCGSLGVLCLGESGCVQRGGDVGMCSPGHWQSLNCFSVSPSRSTEKARCGLAKGHWQKSGMKLLRIFVTLHPGFRQDQILTSLSITMDGKSIV